MTSLSPDPDTTAAGDIADYLAAVTGGARGWLWVCLGTGPYRNKHGNIRFWAWVQVALAWPDQVDDQTLAVLVEQSKELDIYVCPYVMSGAERAKGNSVAPMVIHADVDGGRLDLAKVRELPGAFAVGSGTPGNGHPYVLLDRPVAHHQHEQLCRGAGAYFGATDSKCSDNDVLRPPGTWNHKPTVDGKPPLPVTFAVRPGGERADPDELAHLFGVELTDEPPAPRPRAKGRGKSGGEGGGGVPFEVEAFDLLGYREVQRALAKVTGDRSTDTMHIVAGCVRAGLTQANARWALMQRQDLAHRLLYECRHDDIARCFGRASNEMKDRA